MSVDVDLKYPVQAGTEVINRVTLRRTNGQDIAALEEQPGKAMKRTIWLVARLTSLPISTVEQFDMMDIHAIDEVIQGFLPRGPATGQTSSAI